MLILGRGTCGRPEAQAKPLCLPLYFAVRHKRLKKSIKKTSNPRIIVLKITFYNWLGFFLSNLRIFLLKRERKSTGQVSRKPQLPVGRRETEKNSYAFCVRQAGVRKGGSLENNEEARMLGKHVEAWQASIDMELREVRPFELELRKEGGLGTRSASCSSFMCLTPLRILTSVLELACFSKLPGL